MVMGDGQPTASYAYDVHGDTTAITDGNTLSTHLTYDSQARPVQVTTLDHSTPVTATLTYNPSGQRASYHVVEPGKPTLDQQFTYRAGLLGQVRLTSSSTTAYTDTYLYTDAGAPYELLRTNASGATNRYWYELDGRGNVVALTDINGKVVDRYAYDSWGELTSDDSVNETVPQQLRYAGYWYDEKLSWYWLSVRYYDPEIERFLAPDPSEQDGVRTYAYVDDNPIDGIDPSGLCVITVHFEPVYAVDTSAAGIKIKIPTPFSHAYIYATDSERTVFYEATNQYPIGEDIGMTGFGDLIPAAAPYPNTEPPHPDDQLVLTVPGVRSGPCTSYCNSFNNTTLRVAQAHVPYDPQAHHGNNSNGFITTLLVRAGLAVPPIPTRTTIVYGRGFVARSTQPVVNAPGYGHPIEQRL